MTILTDGRGRPIEKPTAPPEGCSFDDKVAYLRAMAAYADKVGDVANEAFGNATAAARIEWYHGYPKPPREG
jgi:hypothetical protein